MFDRETLTHVTSLSKDKKFLCELI